MSETENSTVQLNEENSGKIIPLSPVEDFNDLNEVTKQDYGVYKEYLNSAVVNSRVGNIAVSGNFGVGKSSILRVFENERLYASRWLHISMGNFRKTDIALEQQNQQTLKERNKYKQDLEIDLLRQITAECKPEEIPRTSFKLVPSQEAKGDIATRYIIPIITAIVVALLFLAFSSILPESARNILFFVLVGFITLGVGWMVFYLFPKLRLNQLTIKTNYTELTAENVQTDSYLERHCFELVYVLETIARKSQNCTVVFEDMDRLDIDLCIDIFSKLREINRLVNRRLKDADSKLKFIYVINDNIMSRMKMEKFFDYIMPIVPLNSKRNLCCCVCTVKLKEILAKEFTNTDDENVVNMINIVCSGLTDFRMIYTCINDYRVFRDVSENHGNSSIEENTLNAKLFSFMIYKNLRPDEYYDICRTGALPNNWLENLPQEQKYLFKLSQAGFLTEDCLRYIGC